MTSLEIWEILSYIVTVIGLPFAIVLFLYQERRERENEEEEVFQLLSNNYQDFLNVVLNNAELKLFSTKATQNLTEEQQERTRVIFEMLISLFERAYLLAFEEKMTAIQKRRWYSWEDNMREWCGREDFARMLPSLLRGEDPDFVKYITVLAEQESISSEAKGK